MATNDHDTAAPPRRRLTRSRDDRVVAGVCGGLGRYFDVDPVIFRIGFVVLLLLGGASLIVYAAAWILLPEDGARRSVGESWLRHGPRGNWLPVVLIIIGALTLADRLSHRNGGAIAFGVAAILFGALLLRPHSAPPADHPTGAGPAPPAVSPVAPPDAPPGPPPPPAAGEAVDGEPGPEPGPPPRRGRSLGGIAFSLLLISSGAVGLLDASGAVSISVPVFLAAALVAVGIALIAGAWVGRTRGLVALGIVLTVALTIASVVRVPFRGGAGDRRWDPVTLQDLRTSYHLGAGDATLNLARLSWDGTRTVRATVGTGHLHVIVPSRMRVVVDGHAGIGEVQLLDRTHDGWDVDNRVADGDASAGTLRLHLDVGLGQIEVTRA